MAINSTRVEREYIWPRNWHMVMGRQWIRWNPAAKKWFALPPRPERASTANHLIGRVAHMAARMLSSRPNFSCLAMNDDPSSRRAAILGEKILEFDWSDLKLFQHRYYATLHMILFGFGLIKYWHDPFTGKVVPKKRLAEMPDGQIVEEDSLRAFEYTGGIKVTSVAPPELLMPPGLYWPDMGVSPWVIHETLMTPEEVKERYGKVVTPETNPTTGFNDGLSADVDRFTYYHFAGDYGRVGRVKVREYYEKPSPQRGFDKGAVITVCQGQVLNTDISQFDDGRYPFALFPGMPEPGKFIPHAWVSDMVGPQVKYNQKGSRLDTWFSLAFYPKILNPSTSGIPDHHFRSGGFEILNFDAMAGGKPEWWAPPPPPGQAFMAMDRDLKDLDGISSQYGFGRGEPQTGAPSGALAQVMIEADSTELGPLITLHARAWEEMGEGLLELHRRFDPPEKLIILSGATGAEVMQYQKTDIPVGMRVAVQEDSLQPKIRAARKQELMTTLQSGLFGNPAQLPPKTRLKLLEWAGHPTTTMAKDPDLLERELIEAENTMLVEMGQDVPVGPTDNDERHLECHSERTLFKDRFTWGDPETSPIWQRLMKHMQAHQERIDQTKQAAEQEQLKQMQMGVDAQKQVIDARADADIRKDFADKGGQAILDAGKPEPEPGAEAPPPA